MNRIANSIKKIESIICPNRSPLGLPLDRTKDQPLNIEEINEVEIELNFLLRIIKKNRDSFLDEKIKIINNEALNNKDIDKSKIFSEELINRDHSMSKNDIKNAFIYANINFNDKHIQHARPRN